MDVVAVHGIWCTSSVCGSTEARVSMARMATIPPHKPICRLTPEPNSDARIPPPLEGTPERAAITAANTTSRAHWSGRDCLASDMVYTLLYRGPPAESPTCGGRPPSGAGSTLIATPPSGSGEATRPLSRRAGGLADATDCAAPVLPPSLLPAVAKRGGGLPAVLRLQHTGRPSARVAKEITRA